MSQTHPDRNLQIRYELVGDESWIVHFNGVLDFAAAESTQAAILQFLEKRPKSLLFDLAGVPYVSSIGLSTLVKLYKTTQAKGIPITFYDALKPVRRVFEISKLDFLLLDPQAIEAPFADFASYINTEEPLRQERRRKEVSRKIPPRLYS